MSDSSIFQILQDSKAQDIWIEICKLHQKTKKYLLLAEEVCEEGAIFLQPLKEHRDAYDHVVRTFSLAIKEVPADFDVLQYVCENLKKALGHEYRAFFDTADWLSFHLRKTIRLRVQKMNSKAKENLKAKCADKGIDNLFRRLNDYPFQISKRRNDKDIAKPSGTADEIREYVKILEELITIYKEIE